MLHSLETRSLVRKIDLCQTLLPYIAMQRGSWTQHHQKKNPNRSKHYIKWIAHPVFIFSLPSKRSLQKATGKHHDVLSETSAELSSLLRFKCCLSAMGKAILGSRFSPGPSFVDTNLSRKDLSTLKYPIECLFKGF